MNRSMLFGCAVAALSVASLPAPGQAMAQGREGAAPVAAPTRQAVPQLRAPAQAERIRPKIQDRTPPVPTTSVAAGPAGAAQGANAAPPGETTNFQGWTVTCFPADGWIAPDLHREDGDPKER
ncbi:hypothetical protein MKK53_11030 [Methylobacterium sp. J-076]|nr:hypothetical protein [Methylobacterium sp. J-076]